MAATLVLVRHAQSQFNMRQLYTGRSDPPLTEYGRAEAEAAGRRLAESGYRFDIAFTSEFLRARHTLQIILQELAQSELPVITDGALNERHYGVLTGLNRQQAVERFGKSNVVAWRRSLDAAPPGGESLNDAFTRVAAFYKHAIVPRLVSGTRALVSAHSNSLRALIMQIERISGEEAMSRPVGTALPIAYQMDSNGAVLSSTVVRDG